MRRCKCGGMSTVYSSKEHDNIMVRHRKCLTCGAKWKTAETELTLEPVSIDRVIKAGYELNTAIAELRKTELFRMGKQ